MLFKLLSGELIGTGARVDLGGRFRRLLNWFQMMVVEEMLKRIHSLRSGSSPPSTKQLNPQSCELHFKAPFLKPADNNIVTIYFPITVLTKEMVYITCNKSLPIQKKKKFYPSKYFICSKQRRGKWISVRQPGVLPIICKQDFRSNAFHSLGKPQTLPVYTYYRS